MTARRTLGARALPFLVALAAAWILPRAAREIQATGGFTFGAEAASYAEVNGFMAGKPASS